MLVEFDGIWWAGEKGGLGKTGEKKKAALALLLEY